MIIGEKMSDAVNFERVIEGASGQLFDGVENIGLGRPLHTAPTLYVLLRKLFADKGVEVEVYMDHASETAVTTLTSSSGVYSRALRMETIRMRKQTIRQVAEQYFKEFSEVDFSVH
jgi:hypothetical protein